MLGKNLFKVESKAELSNDRFKTLVLFYCPLIGNDALALYEFLVVKGNGGSFEEINKILNSLSISIDKFELLISKLNEYKLVKSLKDKNDDRYIFVLNSPLTQEEFIKNDIFVREFILKTSGEYYQSLIFNYRSLDKHENFEDVSHKIDSETLANWNINDEKYLNANFTSTNYDFNTLFDINSFLDDVSNNLLPLKFRTEENLKEIATLADLYNISQDKMRTFIPKVAKSDSNTFDLNLLRYLCENAICDYEIVKQGDYGIPCVLFLMNKQDGKEVSKYDRRILFNLANNYHLKPDVINVLLEYCLNNFDNKLIEKVLYSIASNLNRNDVDNAAKALDFLKASHSNKSSISNNNIEAIPNYNDNHNPVYDETLFNEIMNKRDK